MSYRSYNRLIMNSYIDEWLDDDQYEEFMYNSHGTILLYCNHKEYYDSFRTKPEKRLLATIERNRWQVYYREPYETYEPIIPLSLVDQAMKKLVISEYIRLNILYRSRTKQFCCLRWGVHVFPPFEISTTPILVTKFKVEVLRLNTFYRERCELCWYNDAQNTNRKEHEYKLKEVNKMFNDNYGDANEARRIQRELNLTENISSQSVAPSNKRKRYSIS
jgi:hypothetical protein